MNFVNTVPFGDSTEHYIAVQAVDMSGNTSDSESISVIVDNSSSYAQAINIISIEYTESEMTIVIERSTDIDFNN